MLFHFHIAQLLTRLHASISVGHRPQFHIYCSAYILCAIQSFAQAILLFLVVCYPIPNHHVLIVALIVAGVAIGSNGSSLPTLHGLPVLPRGCHTPCQGSVQVITPCKGRFASGQPQSVRHISVCHHRQHILAQHVQWAGESARWPVAA